jgi:hypothetical protein
MYNKQVEQALDILSQVVDISTASGVFKKAKDVTLVVASLQILSDVLGGKVLPEDKIEPELEKETE